MQKKLRAAVIGRTGRGDYGHGLDTVWHDVPEVELVAVADDDKVGLRKAAERLKVEQTFGDYREMLDRVKPDVVSIAPRWVDAHRDLVVETAQRGVHIYLEKPLCRTLAEADEMVAACERSHVKLALAHQTRYSPKIPVIQELIAEGKLGRIVELRGRGKEDQRGGGEDLWVLGTHVMDLIRTFGGEPEWCVAAVSQDGHAIGPDDVVEGNEGYGPLAGDAVRAMYGLPNGVTAHFSSYRNAGGNPTRFGLEIYGTAGVIRMGTGYLPTAVWLPEASWINAANATAWRNITSAGVDVSEPLDVGGGAHAGNVAAVQDLLAAIKEDRQPLNSIYDGRGNVEMIVACFESQRQGGRVEFPLKNRENPLTKLGG